jgi:hypothetical protein
MNQMCLDFHIKYHCKHTLLCNVCNRIKHHTKNHVCVGQMYCMNCKSVQVEKHLCYILTEEEKANFYLYRTRRKNKGYIFYDYEAFVNERDVHEANLVVATKKCNNCILNNNSCQENCDTKIFYSNDKFCEWLLQAKFHADYTCIAHNFKGIIHFYYFLIKALIWF